MIFIDERSVVMSANIKLFHDSSTTKELTILNGSYVLDVDAERDAKNTNNYLDGDNGDEFVKRLYLKNVGDQTWMDGRLTENSDTEKHTTYSLDGATYNNSLTIGNVNAGSVVSIYVKITIPAGTKNDNNPRNVEFELMGESI